MSAWDRVVDRMTDQHLWGHIGHWFADVAMDGIGGGILGGLIAAWALRRTIRHEREMRDQEREELQKAELRNAAAEFIALLMDPHLTVIELDRDPVPTFLQLIRASYRTNLLALRARDPIADDLLGYQKRMASALDTGTETVDRTEVRRLGGLMLSQLQWLIVVGGSTSPIDWTEGMSQPSDPA